MPKVPRECPHCGCEIYQVRSKEQNDRYHAVVDALYHHWPMCNVVTGAMLDFIPDNREHLRKWLQVKAGYRKVDMVEVPDMTDIKAALKIAEGVARAGNDYKFVRPHGGGIAIFTSLSINYDTLGHKEFCALNEKVAEVIYAETGFETDQLLREHKRAA